MAKLFLVAPSAYQGHWHSSLVAPSPPVGSSTFRLDEYNQAFGPLLFGAIQRQTQDKAPILRAIPTEEVEHVRTTPRHKTYQESGFRSRRLRLRSNGLLTSDRFLTATCIQSARQWI
jgi:hypothetical protein